MGEILTPTSIFLQAKRARVEEKGWVGGLVWTDECRGGGVILDMGGGALYRANR